MGQPECIGSPLPGISMVFVLIKGKFLSYSGRLELLADLSPPHLKPKSLSPSPLRRKRKHHGSQVAIPSRANSRDGGSMAL